MKTKLSKEEKQAMKYYKVFKRTWWKSNPSWTNGLEPCAGRKTTLAKGLTEAAARAFCSQWNGCHNPGRLSMKAEYTEM